MRESVIFVLINVWCRGAAYVWMIAVYSARSLPFQQFRFSHAVMPTKSLKRILPRTTKNMQGTQDKGIPFTGALSPLSGCPIVLDIANVHDAVRPRSTSPTKKRSNQKERPSGLPQTSHGRMHPCPPFLCSSDKIIYGDIPRAHKSRPTLAFNMIRSSGR